MDECQIYYTLGVGTGPPPTAINPDVRPLGTYETLKISGLYSLLLRALTTKELAGKRPACLRSMQRPSTPSQILLCSPGLQSLLLWPIPTFCGNFSLIPLPDLGKTGNGQHTTDKGSYRNEVGVATVCLVSFAALFWMLRNAPPK